MHTKHSDFGPWRILLHLFHLPHFKVKDKLNALTKILICGVLFFLFLFLNISSCWAPQKQIIKGKELLEDLQRDSGVATTSASSLTPAESRDEQPAVADVSTDSSVGRTRSSSSNNSNSSILDLASSLQTQLSKFGHRLDDTRERLEDTSRCYELLDKVK